MAEPLYRRKALPGPLAEDNPAKERFIRENEIIADAKILLFELYRNHPLLIVRDESAHVALTFDALCRFAEQGQDKKLPALLRDLAQLVPGTAISPARTKQKAELARLKEEIAGFIQLRLSLAQAQLRARPGVTVKKNSRPRRAHHHRLPA
ncbi:hypothetical protein ABK905_06595 [Acerihabitans sp. KWT182]|uniref:Uncharacterized protein n=1 Tax=Acerihabitans sp. KWT182 TaxID=3157919 RepID=A0AAU7QD35_9GAMM